MNAVKEPLVVLSYVLTLLVVILVLVIMVINLVMIITLALISTSVILIMVDVITTVSTHKEAISVSVEKDMKLITME